MREIKYQLWNGREMLQVGSIEFFKDGSYNVNYEYPVGHGIKDFPDYYRLREFTGLKDKNGKEIYEGDIISIFGGSQKSEVVWDNEWGGWIIEMQASSASKIEPEFLGNFLYLSVCEIIGNIYENPGLLNQHVPQTTHN